MEQLPKTDPGCRTLGFAVLGRIVSLKILDNFLRAVVGNSCAESCGAFEPLSALEQTVS
jgi:hypothetical protein